MEFVVVGIVVGVISLFCATLGLPLLAASAPPYVALYVAPAAVVIVSALLFIATLVASGRNGVGLEGLVLVLWAVVLSLAILAGFFLGYISWRMNSTRVIIATPTSTQSTSPM